jgi:hypothetical protein
MLDQLARHLGVSTNVAVILLIVVAMQITLQVYALVDLTRRDAVRGDKKWVWAIAIAFGNFIGALAYLVVGRTPQPGARRAGGASTAGGDAARRAVDTVYGPRNDR